MELFFTAAKITLDLVIAAFLVYISYVDIKTMYIRNKALLKLLPFTALRCMVAVLENVFVNGEVWYWALLNQVLGGVGAFAIFLIIGTLLPGAIGGGDIKLIGTIGIAIGWQYMIFAVLFGALLNVVWWVVRVIVGFIREKPVSWYFGLMDAVKMRMAYGPFLATGFAAATILFDYGIWNLLFR